MTYADTARAFARVEETPSRYPNAQRLDAAKLPMSEWAESRRNTMTPQTIAANHAAHVSDTAAALREALIDVTEDTASSGYEIADRLAYAARALLAAIGEEE